MLKTNNVPAIKSSETTAIQATKDTGRVHIGGGAIHFADAAPTKDAGRVHIGGGAICF
jgi:hypothetical protein